MYEIGMAMTNPIICKILVICASGIPPAPKRSDKATNDEAENPAANRSNEKKQQPSFEVIEFLWFFHGCDVYRSNENKMSDGGWGRASLRV